MYLNKERFGATGPELSYVNDNYVVISNFNGILIYNLKERCISGVIDNKGLGVNKIQGSEYTDIIGNDDYIFIYNSASKNDGYMYSLKNNQLQQVYNNDNTLFKHKEIISNDISDKISSEILDNKENLYWSALKNNDKIIVLALDVSSDTPWEILILSENVEKIEEM